MEDNIISLKELMKEYPIYFDAGIFIAFRGRGPQSSEDLITHHKKERDFYVLFEDCINDGANFYIPTSIFEEIHIFEETNYKYGSHEMLSKLYRKRYDRCRALERLKNTLKKENKVLKIDWKDNECKRFGEKYLHLKGEYCMSIPDYNFLIMGMTKLKTESSIGLVSNDSQIFRAKDDILREEHIWKRKVKFFARNKSFYFKKVETLDDLINFKFSS